MPLTRSAKRARVKHVRDQALEVVLDSEFLPWYEAVKVGATCKELQHVWQERKDHLCEPVLDALNELKIGSNVCRWCGKVAFPAAVCQCVCSDEARDTPLAHLDPRFDPNYTELSTWDKCRALINFTATCVSNYQSNFDFDNIASSDGVPPVFRFDWQTRECRFLAEHKPRRLAFMINLVVACGGQCNLYGETPNRIVSFNNAFAGNGFDPSTDSMHYHQLFERSISESFPHIHAGFAAAIQTIHNVFGKVWETLGPVLTSKLAFMVPFFLRIEDGSAIIPDDLELADPQADARALSLFE